MAFNMDWEGNENVDPLMKPKVKTAGELSMDVGAGIEDTYNYGGMSADEIGGTGADLGLLDQIKAVPDALKSAGGLDLGKAFNADNIGGTLSGIGEIAKAAAGIYDAHNKKKYQDKVFAMEEKRVARETARQDKQQAAYEKVFG